MTLLKKAVNTAARAKVGLLGFGGSGKTMTAALIARGLALQRERKAVAMFDTETGSDFLIPLFEDAGISFLTVKSRTFADLLTFCREAPEMADVALIDSVTHVWQDLVTGYQRKLKRARLSFKDWAPIKEEWGRFSAWYVNAPLHAIVCGRAGYEWDMQEDDDGSKELVKTGVKMKAEGEMSYEPSLLIEMQRVGRAGAVTSDPATHGWDHRAVVLKDRAGASGGGMDGAVILNPKFEDFLPHFERLNLGGQHIGIASQGDTADLFESSESRSEYRRQCEIAREEIEAAFVRADISGQSREGKKRIYEMLEACFGVRTWKELEVVNLRQLQAGLEKLYTALLLVPAPRPAPMTEEEDARAQDRAVAAAEGIA